MRASQHLGGKKSLPSLSLLMTTKMVIGILQGKFAANMDQVGENGDYEFRRDGFDDRVLGGGFFRKRHCL